MATTKRRRKKQRWQLTPRRDALKKLKEMEPQNGQIRNPFNRLRYPPEPRYPPE